MKLTAGVIGCGNISGTYLKVAQRLRNLEVAACADLIPARAEAKAKEFGVPAACSVKELLESPDIEIVINLTPIAPRQWMIPSFPPQIQAAIIKSLPRGLALQGHEGPDGQPIAFGGGGGATAGAFYPVIGIPVPSFGGGGREGLEDLPPTQAEGAAPSTRIRPVLVNLGDETMEGFNVRLSKATQGKALRTLLERLTTLRAFAVTLAGEDQADNLLEAWDSLHEAQRRLEALDFGGMLRQDGASYVFQLIFLTGAALTALFSIDNESLGQRGELADAI